MRVSGPVQLNVVQAHEASTAANVRLGGYHMPPADKFETWRVTLDGADIERLLQTNDFAHTTGGTCRLKHLHEGRAVVQPRVIPFIRDCIDLRIAENLEIVILCVELTSRPLLVIDGNHRLSAHYLRFGTVESVPAYACTHPDVNNWGRSSLFSQGLSGSASA